MGSFLSLSAQANHPHEIVGVYDKRGMEGASEAHAFFANGDYCSMQVAMGGGFTVAGNWEGIKSNAKGYQLDIDVQTFFRTPYPVWQVLDETIEKPAIVIDKRYFSESYGFASADTLLGFSPQPDTVTLRPISSDELQENLSIGIPLDANFLFIKNLNNQTLTRYDIRQVKQQLHPLILVYDDSYRILQEFNKSSYFFKNNQLIIKNDNEEHIFKKRAFSQEKMDDSIPLTEQEFIKDSCVDTIKQQQKRDNDYDSVLMMFPDFVKKSTNLLKPTLIDESQYPVKYIINNQSWSQTQPSNR